MERVDERTGEARSGGGYSIVMDAIDALNCRLIFYIYMDIDSDSDSSSNSNHVIYYIAHTATQDICNIHTIERCKTTVVYILSVSRPDRSCSTCAPISDGYRHVVSAGSACRPTRAKADGPCLILAPTRLATSIPVSTFPAVGGARFGFHVLEGRSDGVTWG